MISVYELSFRPLGSGVQPSQPHYRPPSWPPPLDWIVSYDADGNPLSKWSDEWWDFSHEAGRSLRLQFSGTESYRLHALSEGNQHILRMIATWFIWGPGRAQAWNTIINAFRLVRRSISFCDQHGILASDLMRFPAVRSELPTITSNVRGLRTLVVRFDDLWEARETLGFFVLDERGIQDLARAASASDETVQTAYMPPRIWAYQVNRLREFLDDFLSCRVQIEALFLFCIDAYERSYGDLAQFFNCSSSERRQRAPFSSDGERQANRRGYIAKFSDVASEFGVLELLKKWIGGKNSTISAKSFSSYFTLAQLVGTAYIMNFSLQRVAEAHSLKSDCLIWDDDETLGRIALIRGETTKTDPDSDAWWPTHSVVSVAVDVLSTVALLRTECARKNPSISLKNSDVDSYYLANYAFEPWSCGPTIKDAYSIRPAIVSYMSVWERFPKLFDAETLCITEMDQTLALRFTPNLLEDNRFQVGRVWPLAWHQLRRTSAINMRASGDVADTSLQVILKHADIAQSQYYGQNFTRLRFNEEVANIIQNAKHEILAAKVKDLMSARYFSPMSQEAKDRLIVRLMPERDFAELTAAAARGEISFRATRLGGCAKEGACEYGGYESVSRCTGTEKRRPCTEALFDRAKRQSVERELSELERRAKLVNPSSPRGIQLNLDIQGLREFLNGAN